MTRKQRRAVFIVLSIGVLTLAVLLVAVALRDTIVFFHTPKEVAEKNIPVGKRIRLGGLVAEGSLKRGAGTTVEFTITDTVKTIPVSYTGILPTSSARARAWWPKASSTPPAGSSPTPCSPSTTRTTCPPKSPKPSRSKACGKTPASPPRTACRNDGDISERCHPGACPRDPTIRKLPEHPSA
jgi:hypothetical protein